MPCQGPYDRRPQTTAMTGRPGHEKPGWPIHPSPLTRAVVCGPWSVVCSPPTSAPPDLTNRHESRNIYFGLALHVIVPPGPPPQRIFGFLSCCARRLHVPVPANTA